MSDIHSGGVHRNPDSPEPVAEPYSTVYIVRNRACGAVVCIHATEEGAAETVERSTTEHSFSAWVVLP